MRDPKTVANSLFEVKYDNFTRRPFALFRLAFSMLIQDDNARDSSSIRPRYFSCFKIYIFG